MYILYLGAFANKTSALLLVLAPSLQVSAPLRKPIRTRSVRNPLGLGLELELESELWEELDHLDQVILNIILHLILIHKTNLLFNECAYYVNETFYNLLRISALSKNNYLSLIM